MLFKNVKAIGTLAKVNELLIEKPVITMDRFDIAKRYEQGVVREDRRSSNALFLSVVANSSNGV